MDKTTCIIVAIIAIFALIEILPHLLSHWLAKSAEKHRIADRIRRRTPVGNLAYAAYWLVFAVWLVVVGLLVANQARLGFDADSVCGLCVMAFITIMLIRELYRAHRSRCAG